MKVASGIKFAVVPEWVLDAKISHVALRLYAVLDRYAGNDDGTVTRSRRTIAGRLKCSRDTLDRALKQLEDIGAVRVETQERAAGDLDVNTYVLQPGGPDVRQGSRTDAARGSRTDAIRVAARMRHIEESPSYESSKDERTALARDAFDDFWRVYPKHKAKAEARRAWVRRIAKGADARALIAAALSYAEWCLAGGVESPQYIKHAATWLNQGCEEDEHEDPAVLKAKRNGSRRASVGDAWDEIRRRIDDTRRVGADQQDAVLSLPSGK